MIAGSARIVAALLAVALVVSVASAEVYHTFTWNTPFSPSQVSEPVNGAETPPSTTEYDDESYTLRRIDVSGTIQQINGTTEDYVCDNMVWIGFPGSMPDTFDFTYSFSLSTQESYVGLTSFSNFFNVPGGGAPNAPFAAEPVFRFANISDEWPAGSPDARISSLLITFSGDAPSPPEATDLGMIEDLEEAYAVPDLTYTHSGGGVQWYKFSIEDSYDGVNNLFLDIDTEGSLLTSGDTEIGLYDANGALLATDDQDGSGWLSQLTFGAASPVRPALGDGENGDGRDGPLAAGTYYLAVGGYDTTFGSGFDVDTTSLATGDVQVNFRRNTLVPEPSALALLVAGTVGLLSCARKRKLA